MDTSKIVYIHGSGGDKSQTFKAQLLRGIFPGLITSDFDGDLTERMAQLKAVLGRKVGWSLIGSSLGGLIAALFAWQSPDKVRKLVLLAPALTLPEFSGIPAASIELPTTIIQGKNDELIPLRSAQKIAKKVFSNLTYLVVDDNHRLHKTAQKLDWLSILA